MRPRSLPGGRVGQVAHTLGPRLPALHDDHLALVLFAAAMFLIGMDATIVLVALPSISADLGLAVGVALGGLLTSYLGWRQIFVANLPISAVSIFLAPRVLRHGRRRQRRQRLQVASAFMATVGVTLMVYAIIEAPRSGWVSSPTLIFFTVAVAVLVVFLAVQARSAAPMMPLHLLFIRSFVLACVLAFLFEASLNNQFYLLSIGAQYVLHYSAIRTGLLFVPLCVAIVIGTNVGARLTTRLGPARTAELTDGLRNSFYAAAAIVVAAALVATRLPRPQASGPRAARGGNTNEESARRDPEDP